MAQETTEAADAPARGEGLVAWKGFDGSLSCRGHTFEIGRTYAVSGEVLVSRNGFHACADPLDVWAHFGPVGDDGSLNRFGEVELSGAVSSQADVGPNDSSLAAEYIVVRADFSLSSWVGKLVTWTIDATPARDDEPDGDGTRMGSRAARARLCSSSNGARIGSGGYDARIAACGADAHVAASGYGARIASSGGNARIGAAGYNARVSSSGDGTRIGATGDRARLSASGNNTRVGAGGHRARISASGEGARIAASGPEAVITSSGRGAVARGVEGTWIALAEFDDAGRCIGFATGCIGRDGLKADTDYRAAGGRLVEAGPPHAAP